jgi:hypothetical protein
MRGMKIAAVVVGALVVFFVVDSLVHVVLGLLTALAFVAIVAGGVYVAVKINSARKRQVKPRREEYEVRDEPRPAPRTTLPAVPHSAPAPPSANVDDELARLKREMGG